MKLKTQLLCALAVAALCLPASAAGSAKRPNFLFIFGEGQGWTSTSVQMDDTLPASKGDIVRTPNLEKIATQGMRFASAYAPSPRCTPSRASVFTGKSPAQLHMTFVNEGGRAGKGETVSTRIIPPSPVMEMPASEVMIGGLLKRAGYATAHFGKWHVGRVSPKEHGYDETDGANNNGGPENVETPNPKQAFAITRLGMDFMERQLKAGKPFYLQVCHYAGRGPTGALKETLESVTQRAERGAGRGNEKGLVDIAVMEDMDTTVGMLLAKLKELGIAGNTYVIYTPDHGTPGKNTPLTGGKGGVWDGGIRVPLVIAGPGIAPNVCSHVRVSGTDLFPTIAELAGVRELPRGIEGGSLVPLLTGGGKGLVKRPREEFVVHFPHYDKDADGPASAILLGNYKLMRIYETGERRLFDLSKDISERNDLAKQLPQKVAELDQRLTDYLTAMNAQMPTLNPNYDPSKPQTEPKRGGKGKGGKKNQ